MGDFGKGRKNIYISIWCFYNVGTWEKIHFKLGVFKNKGYVVCNSQDSHISEWARAEKGKKRFSWFHSFRKPTGTCKKKIHILGKRERCQNYLKNRIERSQKSMNSVPVKHEGMDQKIKFIPHNWSSGDLKCISAL